jgi:hypothetical protein
MARRRFSSSPWQRPDVLPLLESLSHIIEPRPGMVGKRDNSKFAKFATQQDLNQGKSWIMSRSSTRHHIFNLVVIEPELSEKFKVSD